jgi:ATP-dependent protease ClpP protease subunit
MVTDMYTLIYFKVNLLAKHTEKTPEQIEADTRRPKYFSPSEAVEYGIIDKVFVIPRLDCFFFESVIYLAN